jgi:hypothetical protein
VSQWAGCLWFEEVIQALNTVTSLLHR